MKKIKFKSPKDELGNDYYVPIVVQNKAFLKGFIVAYNILSSIYEISLKDISSCISSVRFNDILFDDTRIKDLSRPQLKEKFKIMMGVYEANHPDNDETVYDDYVVNFNCNGCGMFFGFKDYTDLPDNDFNCTCCGRKLIVYTNKEDQEFEFFDDSKVIASVIEEIHGELNKHKEPESDEEED